MVLLLDRRRLLPRQPGVDRRPPATVRGAARLHTESAPRRGPGATVEHLRSERERIATGYRALLDEEDAAGFDNLLALSRQVFPFVENHNFYVEHWHHSIFFNKVRELGAVMVAGGMLEDADDIFFLHRYEVYSLLYEVEVRWAIARTDAGRVHLARRGRPSPADLRRARGVEPARPRSACPPNG